MSQAVAAVRDVMAQFYDWEAKQFLKRQMLDIGFYKRLAAGSGGPVLELFGGTGRVTVPLAEAGHLLCSVDLSESALEQAERKANISGVRDRIEFFRQDVRTFDLGRRFPLIIIPYNAFQLLLAEADQRACLRRIRQHLEDDGILAMEICPFQQKMTEEKIERKHLRTDTSLDGRSVISMYESVENDFDNKITHYNEEYVVSTPGCPDETCEFTLSVRTVYRRDMETLFETEGFDVKALYGNYEFGPYPDPEMTSLLYVAGRGN